MKALVPHGRRGAGDPLYELTPHYDVRARRNGLIVGSVRYAFWNGEHHCVAIQLHNGMPAWGKAPAEFAPFKLHEGDPPWSAPVVCPGPLTPVAPSAMLSLAAPAHPTKGGDP